MCDALFGIGPPGGARVYNGSGWRYGDPAPKSTAVCTTAGSHATSECDGTHAPAATTPATTTAIERRVPVVATDEPAVVAAGDQKLNARRTYSFNDNDRLDKIASKLKVLGMEDDADIVFLMARAARAGVLEKERFSTPVRTYSPATGYQSGPAYKAKCGHPYTCLVWPTGAASYCGWCSDVEVSEAMIDDLTDKLHELVEHIDDPTIRQMCAPYLRDTLVEDEVSFDVSGLQ
jgi:hypothetical protein